MVVWGFNLLLVFIFFFSSRRRHTRYWRDWSSDVCSSDLRRLVALARRRDLLVLEDNPYGLLRYEGSPLPTLFSLDGGEYVIYLGTFSKILSPGLRLGWTAAPRPVLDKLNLGKGAADLCSSPLTQHFVRAYFAERDWRSYLASLCGLYRRRRDIMLEALAEHLPPEATWTRPQ